MSACVYCDGAHASSVCTRPLEHSLRRVLNENQALLDNLTSTQACCTELIQENRALIRELESLRAHHKFVSELFQKEREAWAADRRNWKANIADLQAQLTPKP